MSEKVEKGEYLIAYAYPTSQMAYELGRAKDGCYYLILHKKKPMPCASLADACAKAEGLKKARWSI